FSATLKLAEDFNLGENETKSITIFGKEYTLYNPPVDIKYSIAKEGATVDGSDTIKWTVEINATADDKPTNASLKGLQFYDNLTGVGEYEKNSFKVGKTVEDLTPT
ncbi:MAG TPA: hypothetical protein DD738_06090, partial [Ruminiclostridium sp.]|nr:hypothetical protein [Ruminiclostridium sp.]